MRVGLSDCRSLFGAGLLLLYLWVPLLVLSVLESYGVAPPAVPWSLWLLGLTVLSTFGMGVLVGAGWVTGKRSQARSRQSSGVKEVN